MPWLPSLQNYQQTLDITVAENEKVFFIVSGAYPIHLTGNYVIDNGEEKSRTVRTTRTIMISRAWRTCSATTISPATSSMRSSSRLRVKEIDTDEEEVPKLLNTKKGKKRPAEDDEEADAKPAKGLDEMIAKEAKVEAKLSKKQLKKLKNNKGEAVATQEDEAKSLAKDKKFQFAKNLEQGPTGSAEKPKPQQPEKDKKARGLGVKVVQGVTIDDRKLGSGRAVKSGDNVGMRYIGKLQDGKVFDCEFPSSR